MSIGDYLVLQSNPISEMARGSSSLCVFEIVQSVPSAQLTWNSTVGPGPDRYRSASGDATVIEPGIKPKVTGSESGFVLYPVAMLVSSSLYSGIRTVTHLFRG